MKSVKVYRRFESQIRLAFANAVTSVSIEARPSESSGTAFASWSTSEGTVTVSGQTATVTVPPSVSSEWPWDAAVLTISADGQAAEPVRLIVSDESSPGGQTPPLLTEIVGAVLGNGMPVKDYVDDQDAATLASAKGYTNSQVQGVWIDIDVAADATLTSAKQHADAGDAATLAAARAYTDQNGGGGGAAAYPVVNDPGSGLMEGYVDGRQHIAVDFAASGQGSNTRAVRADDARLSDARTPAKHASTHAAGGSDVLTPANIGAVSTSDSRLSDARTPTAHTHPLSDLGRSGAATGQVPTWNGSAWAPAAAGGGGALTPTSMPISVVETTATEAFTAGQSRRKSMTWTGTKPSTGRLVLLAVTAAPAAASPDAAFIVTPEQNGVGSTGNGFYCYVYSVKAFASAAYTIRWVIGWVA